MAQNANLVNRAQPPDAPCPQVCPSVVCICAGFTWVDGCEQQPQKANKMNCTGPAVLAAAAAAAGAKVVWYSTDYIFDGGVTTPGGATGKAGPYSEGDDVAPLNVYGSSKLAGEAAVLKADPTAIVIRTNVVFGPEVRHPPVSDHLSSLGLLFRAMFCVWRLLFSFLLPIISSAIGSEAEAFFSSITLRSAL
jgi:dTDP-4-dehydrorhamnose reductase